MDADSFTVHIITEYIYLDIANNVVTRRDTSNYEIERLLLPKKKKKIIGLMKNELSEKSMTEFAALRLKSYSYLTKDNDENKKSRMHRKVFQKKET